MDTFDSVVWRLHGVTGSEPGWMAYDNGTVALTLEDGSDSPQEVFVVPVNEIQDVKFPVSQMSGGCNFVVAGEKYRLSFVQPQNTQLPGAYGAIKGVGSIRSARKAGKTWKSILS